MPDLIAQGPETQDRWRRTLPSGRRLVLGRASGAWATPWDDRISRRHVEICWLNGRLEVIKLPDARNPVFCRGRSYERFFVKPGEHFVIGGTTFTLADEQVNVTDDAPLPVSEQTFTAQYLKRVRFRNADQRIEVLSRLPEIVSGASTDVEMLVRLVNVLLTGIPRASAAAVVALRQDAEGESHVEVLHWDRRMLTGEEFRPSERLIRRAAESSESVVHVWTGGADRSRSAFTVSENIDWALCTPLQARSARIKRRRLQPALRTRTSCATI
jgi:adenylate cyclase